MIYHLYFALIMTGYSATSILLGSYMMRYADATELDLGFLFMIQPLTIMLRPIICAQADRYQSHRQLMAFFALLSALAYVPFIALPFLSDTLATLEAPAAEPVGQLEPADSSWPPLGQLKYWSLVGFHTIGSVGFCGVRSLGDGLAVNYAKRIGADFARYRKYGSISYGLCGFALGHINQNWLLPDFVPSLLVYSVSMFSLAVLVFAWPNQYFIMCSRNYDDASVRADYLASLPTSGETARHIGVTLAGALLPRCCGGGGGGGGGGARNQPPEAKLNGWAASNANLAAAAAPKRKKLALQVPSLDASVDVNGNFTSNSASSPPQQHSNELVVDDRTKHLSARQQLSIFALLLKRDFRVALYLLTMFYAGLVGYSGPNFVFTYINVVCHERGNCNGAELTGLVIIVYCCVETICYMLIDRFRAHLNRVLMIELTFVSLTIHYYFYGFALEHLSPYYFLVESLHGIEYSIGLSTCVELGYYFAREVELLLPELIRRGIISSQDNQELVKVSLLATMSGCFTLVYDGFGCILGSLIFGLVTGHYSFITTWIVIGSLAVIGFALILIFFALGKCLGIKPEISRIRARAASAANSGLGSNQPGALASRS